MSAAWTEFYKGRVLSDGYRAYCFGRYLPFLQAIATHVKSGDRVIEIGCGLGTMTSLLADPTKAGALLPPHVGFRAQDVSPDMVALTRLNLAKEGFPVDCVAAQMGTGFRADVVHSHGMLEHFNDREIQNVIHAHESEGVRAAVHYVPGNKYEKPSFGDERLLPIEQWVDICAPIKKPTAFTFNNGYDYCLVFDWSTPRRE